MNRPVVRVSVLAAVAFIVFALLPGPARGGVSVVDSSWLGRGIPDEVAAAGGDAGLLIFSADDQVRRVVVGAGPPTGVPIVQVVPIEKDIGPLHFENWRSSLPEAGRKEGVFVLDNGIIRGNGRFAGIRVLPLTRPGDWPRRPVAVVDPGFFLALYKDEVRTPMIGLVMKWVKTLRAAGVDPPRAWIVDRNRELDFPLEFGYLPGLVREALDNLAAFRDALPETWERLDRAQYLAFFAQTDEALREYAAVARASGLPAASYQAAQLSFRHRDIDAGVAYLEAAGRKDPDYARGFLVQGFNLGSKGELGAAEKVLRAGRRLFPGNEMISIAFARVLGEEAWHLRNDRAVSGKLLDEALSLPVPEAVRDEIRAPWGK